MTHTRRTDRILRRTQDALVDALERGHLAGADVTAPEPLPAGEPLLNVVDKAVGD